MEHIRRQLAINQDYYPDPSVRRRQGSAAGSVISISSDTNTPPSAPKYRFQNRVNSDDDEALDSPPSFPIPHPYLPAKIQTSSKNSSNKYPTHITSSSKVPTDEPTIPFLPTTEDFDLTSIDREVIYEPTTSAADAEKALKELLQSSISSELDVDPEDRFVDGFNEGITLMPHQVQGRAWMAEREQHKKYGGILADMGLGKTVQTLARIVEGKPTTTDRKAGYASTTLIVCPVGLIAQWAKEIDKMCTNLKVICHHGASRHRDPSQLIRANIVITSYNLVATEWETYLGGKSQLKAKGNAEDSSSETGNSGTDDGSDGFGSTLKRKKILPKKPTKAPLDALFRVKWYRIVLDEAQNIKNRKAKCSKACFDLQAKYRWCLTGTPIQNNVEELFSLLHFLQIRPLNDWAKFNETIAKPVKQGKSQRPMKRLQVILRAIMLRRTKTQTINGTPLLNLPKRSITVVECEFDEDEQAFYSALEARTSLTFNKFMKSGQVMSNYTSVLLLLLRLRQACDHPQLVTKDFLSDKEAAEMNLGSPQSNEDKDADELAELFNQMGVAKSNLGCAICQAKLDEYSDAEHCMDCNSQIISGQKFLSATAANPNLPHSSAKIRKILELLENIRQRSNGQEKTIIFSQFTTMLNQIEPWLKHHKIGFVRYDGSMTAKKREEALDKLKESKAINLILISFKAGSTGLNLTVCNNVILVDLWWNPALEDQAFDRSHRLGQKRDVNIWKLTIPNTVENRILALQDKKRDLAKAALSGDKLKNTRLGLDDLIGLFRPGNDEDD